MLGLVFELFQLLLALADESVIVWVPECLQGDHRVENAWEDCGQTVGPLKSLYHPFLGLFQRAFAERMDIEPGEMLRKPVD